MRQSPIDLNLLAGEVIGIVRPGAALRKVWLTIEPASTLPPLCGDRIQLQQVLLNLLLNAMDAFFSTLPVANKGSAS